MNKVLYMKITMLEKLHTKAVIENDKDMAKHLLYDLEELYDYEERLKKGIKLQ